MMTGRESLNERSVEASMSYNLPPHHQSHSTGQGPPQVTNAANAEKVASAKIKVENYIRAQDINLGSVFAILDSDGNKSITVNEFRSKIKALHIPMEDDEVYALYAALDANKDGNIDYGELVEMFVEVNTSQLIRKIKRTIDGSKIPPEVLFDRYCKSDG